MIIANTFFIKIHIESILIYYTKTVKIEICLTVLTVGILFNVRRLQHWQIPFVQYPYNGES